MSFFDWIPEENFAQELRLAKIAELMSKRAKRKINHEKVLRLMDMIQQLEIEASELCDAEERLEDDLARNKS